MHITYWLDQASKIVKLSQLKQVRDDGKLVDAIAQDLEQRTQVGNTYHSKARLPRLIGLDSVVSLHTNNNMYFLAMSKWIQLNWRPAHSDPSPYSECSLLRGFT